MTSHTIKQFLGLNNVTDPLRLQDRAQTRADNVNITSAAGITRRKGFQRVVAADARNAHATADGQRLYLQDDTRILCVLPDMSTQPVAAGLSGAPVSWAEFNGSVYFSDPAGSSGVITPANEVLRWRWEAPPQPDVSVAPGALPAGLYRVAYTYLMADGRETGLSLAAEVDLPSGGAIILASPPAIDGLRTLVYIAPADSTVMQRAGEARDYFFWDAGPDSLGAEATTGFTDPLPHGVTVLETVAGRIFAAMPMEADDQTAVWFSAPLTPHLWNLERDYFMVPGEVLMLAPAPDGLLVGTDRSIYHYSPANRALRELADWGVAPGHAWAQGPEGRTYVWTQRGLCAYPDFENLTERRVSVPPGVHVAAAMIHDEGQTRFVAALQRGGDAFNPLI